MKTLIATTALTLAMAGSALSTAAWAQDHEPPAMAAGTAGDGRHGAEGRGGGGGGFRGGEARGGGGGGFQRPAAAAPQPAQAATASNGGQRFGGGARNADQGGRSFGDRQGWAGRQNGGFAAPQQPAQATPQPSGEQNRFGGQRFGGGQGFQGQRFGGQGQAFPNGQQAAPSGGVQGQRFGNGDGRSNGQRFGGGDGRFNGQRFGGGQRGGFSYRGAYHERFRAAPFRYPRGYGYRPYRLGERLPYLFLGSSYFLSDYSSYYLAPPPLPQYRWVRYGPDALLVDTYTGEVVDAAYGVFDDGGVYGDGAWDQTYDRGPY